jgi:hypothetical protein
MRGQCDPLKWLSCKLKPIAFDLWGYCVLAPVGASFCYSHPSPGRAALSAAPGDESVYHRIVTIGQ